MSRCSSIVLTVNGRVGLVLEGKTLGRPAILMMSGAWPPPAPSVWKGVDRPAVDRRDRVVDKSALVERIGMDGDLDVVLVGHLQAGVDDGEGGAPVFVELQAAGTGLDLGLERLGHAAVALAEDAHVDRQALECLEHPHDVPRARRAGGRPRARGRAGAAADQRGDARGDGHVDLLRADEVDVGVDAARPCRSCPRRR